MGTRCGCEVRGPGGWVDLSFALGRQREGELFDEDDDHVAQISELLGAYGETKRGGRSSSELLES